MIQSNGSYDADLIAQTEFVNSLQKCSSDQNIVVLEIESVVMVIIDQQMT